MALERRELYLIMAAAKLAEKSFVASLPRAYHLKINDKTRDANSLLIVLHLLWLGRQQFLL